MESQDAFGAQAEALADRLRKQASASLQQVCSHHHRIQTSCRRWARFSRATVAGDLGTARAAILDWGISISEGVDTFRGNFRRRKVCRNGQRRRTALVFVFRYILLRTTSLPLPTTCHTMSNIHFRHPTNPHTITPGLRGIRTLLLQGSGVVVLKVLKTVQGTGRKSTQIGRHVIRST